MIALSHEVFGCVVARNHRSRHTVYPHHCPYPMVTGWNMETLIEVLREQGEILREQGEVLRDDIIAAIRFPEEVEVAASKCSSDQW